MTLTGIIEITNYWSLKQNPEIYFEAKFSNLFARN